MKYCLSLTFMLLVELSFGQIKTIANTELQGASGVFFAAQMDQSASTIEITMQGPDDRWFGIGFGLNMSDADPLLYTDGKVGALHALDVWDYTLNAQNAAGVSNDGQQDWTVISNTTAGGTRTIVASRSLNTGDANDHVVDFNAASIDLVWAKGNTADFTLSYHGTGNRGTATLSWTALDVTPPALAIGPFDPADDAINVDPAQNLTITFDEDIVLGNGTLTIHDLSNGGVFQAIDVQMSEITVSGTVVTINPTNDLQPLTEYYVEIDGDCFYDVASNIYAGFNDTTTWNFTTDAVGISELEADFDISLANRKLTVKNEGGNLYNLKIVTAEGRIAFTEFAQAGNLVFDVSEFAPGMLFVQIVSNDDSFVKVISNL